MILENAMIFQGEHGFVPGSVCTEGGRFEAVGEVDRGASREAQACIDLQGAYLIPGLIDIHTHGNMGCDFSDGEYDGLVTMGRYLAGNGITSFLPTSMTLPYETLERAYKAAQRYVREAPEMAARVLGIHMEGPFFSEKKKGAQNGAYLRAPDFAAFEKLYENCGGLIRVPVHQQQLIKRYLRFCRKYYQEHGEKPTDRELCRYLDITPDQLLNLKNDLNAVDIQSLDCPLPGNPEATEGDFVCDPRADTQTEVIESVFVQERHRAVWSAVDQLPEENGQAIRLHYLSGLTYE